QCGMFALLTSHWICNIIHSEYFFFNVVRPAPLWLNETFKINNNNMNQSYFIYIRYKRKNLQEEESGIQNVYLKDIPNYNSSSDDDEEEDISMLFTWEQGPTLDVIDFMVKADVCLVNLSKGKGMGYTRFILLATKNIRIDNIPIPINALKVDIINKCLKFCIQGYCLHESLCLLTTWQQATMGGVVAMENILLIKKATTTSGVSVEISELSSYAIFVEIEYNMEQIDQL
ncbi:hypothetical protein ACJX0J_018747, partial [Zea mays]